MEEERNKRILMKRLYAFAGGLLDEDQLKAVVDGIGTMSDIDIQATTDRHQFATWITIRDFESKHVGRGQRRTVDTGTSLISRDMEFGRHLRWEYKDNGIEIRNEEKRIANYNMRVVNVSLVETRETSDFAEDRYDRSCRRIFIFIPGRIDNDQIA